jgi:hypothetical protein
MLLGLFLVVTCFSALAQRSGKAYSEDLSVYRLKFQNKEDTAKRVAVSDTLIKDIPARRNVNVQVDAILDSIDRLNQTKKFVDGFTIQVYAGQKKADAMNAKQKVMTETPDLTANMVYIQPKFRVTIGSYLSRMEAQKDLARLVRIIPNSILVPEKLQLK